MRLSKSETYLTCTAGMLGALVFLQGAYNADETAMDVGKNLMIFATTYYCSDIPLFRFATFLGALNCVFWREHTDVSNVVCGFAGAGAMVDYLNKLNQGEEPTRLTF